MKGTIIQVRIPNEVSQDDLQKIHDAIEESIDCDVIEWREKVVDQDSHVVIYEP